MVQQNVDNKPARKLLVRLENWVMNPCNLLFETIPKKPEKMITTKKCLITNKRTKNSVQLCEAWWLHS